ncbi:hypothetical protein AB0F39_34565 [Streptomyces murinus]|uniref:hypothetical protein n=1 Tax=Streptomyces murinus TaxID=33900 RepID=UPI0033D6615A
MIIDPALPEKIQHLIREAPPRDLHIDLSARGRWWMPRRAKRLHDVRRQYVLSSELTKDARRLVGRADWAAHEVLASEMHDRGLIDRQRNEVSVPAQVWEIADALREYSRLVQTGPEASEDAQVAALLDTRRRALQRSVDGIERRVIALEEYASKVAEADRQYLKLRETRQAADRLAADSDAVLDLLARTARDDLAVAEIEGMAGEAAAAAAAALEAAHEAAVIALPLPHKTA